MNDASPEPDWRPLIAALANPGTRRMFAEVVVGEEPEAIGAFLSASKRQHARAALLTGGLVTEVDGRLVERGDVYARVLAAAARPRPTGPERFLTGRGEIDRYPTDDAELRALLELVAQRALAESEVVTEKELNERLSRFDADTVSISPCCRKRRGPYVRQPPSRFCCAMPRTSGWYRTCPQTSEERRRA